MASIELYSGDPQVLDYTVHATPGSFTAGDLVSTDSSGYIRIAQSDTAIMGIARTDTSGVPPKNKIPVELLDPDAIYSIRLNDSGTDTTTGATSTIIGDAVGIDDITTPGVQMASDTSGDTAIAYVVGLDPRDASGTVGGRILIRFLPTMLMKQY